MNGMLLAAGRGERMEPLSSVVAKPALEVAGRPLLASALRALVEAGCSPLVANLHRHPDQVRRAVGRIHGSAVFSSEPELLGSAGGIGAARPLFSAGPVLVGNADVWADLDLTPLLGEAAGDEVVMGLVPHPDRRRWSAVQLDRAGRVTAIDRAGAARGYLFSGFQLLGPEVVAGLPSHRADMGPVWRRLMAAGRLRGVVLAGTWREAGDPEAYRRLVNDVVRDSPWVDDGADVEATATVTASAVGRGCAVGSGAVVDASVLTAGATVGPHATVRRCVLAAVTVAADTVLEGMLATPAGTVPL